MHASELLSIIAVSAVPVAYESPDKGHWETARIYCLVEVLQAQRGRWGVKKVSGDIPKKAVSSSVLWLIWGLNQETIFVSMQL